MPTNYLSELKWDEKGRPYRTYTMNFAKVSGGHKIGDRFYVDPTMVRPGTTHEQKVKDWAATQTRPGGSLLRHEGKFNTRTGEWERPINWGNVANMAVGGFLTAGVGNIIAGGAGAAANAIPASTLINTAPAGLTAAATTAVPAAITSGAAAAGIPLAAGGTAAGLWGTGMTAAQLAGLGMDGVNSWMNYRANSRTSDAYERQQTEAERAALVREKALADALAFAKQQYEDQTRREQERWDAYEARRVPYRQASLDSLAALRALVGI